MPVYDYECISCGNVEEIARKDQLSIAKFNAAMRKIQLQEKEAKDTDNG